MKLFLVIVWVYVVNGDVFFVCAAIDVYIAVSVDLNDGEWSFGGRGELGFLSMFVLLLYSMDLVAYLVGVWDAHLLFLVIVCNGLMAALHF